MNDHRKWGAVLPTSPIFSSAQVLSLQHSPDVLPRSHPIPRCNPLKGVQPFLKILPGIAEHRKSVTIHERHVPLGVRLKDRLGQKISELLVFLLTLAECLLCPSSVSLLSLAPSQLSPELSDFSKEILPCPVSVPHHILPDPSRYLTDQTHGKPDSDPAHTAFRARKRTQIMCHHFLPPVSLLSDGPCRLIAEKANWRRKNTAMVETLWISADTSASVGQGSAR